jgi:hypothetical protein
MNNRKNVCCLVLEQNLIGLTDQRICQILTMRAKHFLDSNTLMYVIHILAGSVGFGPTTF